MTHSELTKSTKCPSSVAASNLLGGDGGGLVVGEGLRRIDIVRRKGLLRRHRDRAQAQFPKQWYDPYFMMTKVRLLHWTKTIQVVLHKEGAYLQIILDQQQNIAL